MRETLAALGIAALSVGAGACVGNLIWLATRRPSDRRRRVVPPPGRPRPPYANQLGQLGVLPFTEHPNDAELDNLALMVFPQEFKLIGPPHAHWDAPCTADCYNPKPQDGDLRRHEGRVQEWSEGGWHDVPDSPPLLRPQDTAVFKEKPDERA